MTTSKKRPVEADEAHDPAAKKRRKGFRVGPENLPDGPWRRKVDKIKKDLIHKAKVKKAYKKIKPAELASASKPALAGIDAGSVTIVNVVNAGDDEGRGSGKGETGADAREEDEKGESEPSSPSVHPQRQAMLDDDDDDDVTSAPHDTSEAGDHGPRQTGRPERPNSRKRKPGYFDEALSLAESKKAEAAERAAEQARRAAERQRKTEDRERFRRAMAKARKPGRDGQRRLGRESGLLLEKVKKMVA
ncbi:hypothetical protein F5Y14DRAFT_7162 [Nemania sp. NC0429]|nr:hypothetical protein F5Y14DRAFT_7162 [Nemania sp. NC0429]